MFNKSCRCDIPPIFFIPQHHWPFMPICDSPPNHSKMWFGKFGFETVWKIFFTGSSCDKELILGTTVDSWFVSPDNTGPVNQVPVCILSSPIETILLPLLQLTKAWEPQDIVEIRHHGDIVEGYGKNNSTPGVELALTRSCVGHQQKTRQRQ